MATPTISRAQGSIHSDSPVITSANALPLSPFLDSVPTPSFWPTQVWPTPVWLCFLKGSRVKFEHDDKDFMTSEDVADFCTTPGGRRRDDMNFYTSGMKIVEILDVKASPASARVCTLEKSKCLLKIKKIRTITFIRHSSGAF